MADNVVFGSNDVDMHAVGAGIVAWLETRINEAGSIHVPPSSQENRPYPFYVSFMLLGGIYQREKGHIKSNSYEVTYRIQITAMDKAKEQAKKDIEQIIGKATQEINNPQGIPASGPPFDIASSVAILTMVRAEEFERIALDTIITNVQMIVRKR